VSLGLSVVGGLAETGAGGWGRDSGCDGPVWLRCLGRDLSGPARRCRPRPVRLLA